MGINMLSTVNVNSAHKLMMRPDGRCYVFPNAAAASNFSNSSAVECDEQPVSRTYQYRKVMKPMLERKRRARINRCLDELKELILAALQSEGENVSKLEKADILELTVSHLRKLQHQRALRLGSEKISADRFLAGFTHCANEVSKYLTTVFQKQQQQQPYANSPHQSSNSTKLANSAISSSSSSVNANDESSATPPPPTPIIDHSSGVKLLQHLTTCIKRIEEHATYRREDFYFTPYSTPPPSPSSPNLPTFIKLETHNSTSPLSTSVWRPW